MADTISFDLVSPEQLLLTEQAAMVTIPGTEGDLGVMVGHAPVITTLRPGTITVTGGSKGIATYFVAGGFAEVNAEKITVLAEEAVLFSELDVDARIAAATEAVAAAKTPEVRVKNQAVVDFLSSVKSAH